MGELNEKDKKICVYINVYTSIRTNVLCNTMNEVITSNHVPETSR